MRLLSLALAWITGLLLGLEFSAPVAALAAFLSACAVLALLLRALKRSTWMAILGLVLVAGVLRVEVSRTDAPTLSRYNGGGVVNVEGVVVNDPELRGGYVKLVVEGWLSSDAGTSGRVQIWVAPSRELISQRQEPYLRYGDYVRLDGNLERPEPFGGFDYAEYLASQGIGSVMYYPKVVLLGEGSGNAALRGIYAFRHRLERALTASLPGEQAALAKAILLGLRGDVSDEMSGAFRRTGTSHVMAISGLHIGLVMALALGIGVAVFGRRRNVYLLLPLLAVWGFALLAGLPASAERAAIMATVYLAALALGRQRSVLPALSLAAAVMAGLDPKALKDASFQLSVTAVAGIALLSPGISRPIWACLGRAGTASQERIPGLRPMVNGLSVCLAATIATLPLVAFHFHQVSAVGIPATLLLLPALPFALAGSALASAGGLAAPVLGTVLGWMAYLPLAYVTGLVDMLSRLPGAAFSVGALGGLLLWLFYGAGIGALLLPRYSRRVLDVLARLKERLKVPGPGLRTPFGARLALLAVPPVFLACTTFLLWMAVMSGPDGRLHVSFLDVGQGDAIFIETPSGRQVLVDGGPDPRRLLAALGRHMPFWDRSLDMVVLTHPQDDHLGGLVEVVNRYDVGFAFEGLPGETALYQQWRDALDRGGTPLTAVQGRYAVLLEEGLALEVLGPSGTPIGGTSATNENSIVLRLGWGRMSFLLTGDIEQRGEWRLLESHAALDSTVLKVAHHGSATSSSAEFLEAVSPHVAVVSVAAENDFGHPMPEVLARLYEQVGERVYLTSEHGTVTFTTDGQQLWVKTDR